MAEKPKQPQRDERLDRLIESAIASLGQVPPDELPHRLKQQLRGQISGEVDVETYVQEILKARHSRS